MSAGTNMPRSNICCLRSPMVFAEKVKDAEDAVTRAQQQFPDDADFIQVEAHLRDIFDQENRGIL